MQSWHRDGSWLYFCVDASLMGFAVWGVPSEPEVDRLMRALDAELVAPPHASLVDFSRLQAVPPHGFAAMGAWLAEHADALRTRVTAQALVRPDGLVGSVVAGFYDVQTPSYPSSVHTRVEDALVALGRNDPSLPQFLQDHCGELREVAAIHAAVRAGDASIAAIAKTLAMTERTLQRRLADEGTSFREEVMRARIEQAKRMLLTESQMSRVALEVGFSSLQHFNRAFKQREGMLPSEFAAQAKHKQ